jgi:hypothetical protein
VIDAADSGNGKFRVLIIQQEGKPWPPSKYLRQGIRAQGWLLLGQVSIGYELWRLFNGFSPTITPPEDLQLDGPGKKK